MLPEINHITEYMLNTAYKLKITLFLLKGETKNMMNNNIVKDKHLFHFLF